MTDQVDTETMSEMRAWASDCSWREAEDNFMDSDEYIEGLSDEEVLAGVVRHFGSANGFREAIGLEVPE